MKLSGEQEKRERERRITGPLYQISEIHNNETFLRSSPLIKGFVITGIYHPIRYHEVGLFPFIDILIPFNQPQYSISAHVV